MMRDVLQMEYLNEEMQLTMAELRAQLAVPTQLWDALIDEGIIDPCQDRFTGIDLMRARRAIMLHEQLELNWPGVALTLELLERIRQLEQKLARLGY